MISLAQRIEPFVKLGVYLRLFHPGAEKPVVVRQETDAFEKLEEVVKNASNHNGWFTEKNVGLMLVALGENLREQKLEKWLNTYSDRLEKQQKANTIAVVMAGNIPAVGFHDFLSVLISGNHLLAKLSSDDEKLLPSIADLLISIEPAFQNKIEFTTSRIKNFDAVIATGSDNSSRYFQYYFGKYPHIIRKNRNGVAILTGNETPTDLEGLADDIFSYYGLGCRNVSKLFVPKGYDFDALLEVLSGKKEVIENHKYFNNYEYNKAIFLVNSRVYFDTGTVLLVEEDTIASPVSVLNFEYYKDESQLRQRLIPDSDRIQCVVSGTDVTPGVVAFGKSQQPELWDYADGVDTLDFLSGLK